MRSLTTADITQHAIVKEYRAIFGDKSFDDVTVNSTMNIRYTIVAFSFIKIIGDPIAADTLQALGEDFDLVPLSETDEKLTFRLKRPGLSAQIDLEGEKKGTIGISELASDQFSGLIVLHGERYTLRPLNLSVDGQPGIKVHLLGKLRQRADPEPVDCSAFVSPSWYMAMLFLFNRWILGIFSRTQSLVSTTGYDPDEKIGVYVIYDKISSRDMVGNHDIIAEELVSSLNVGLENTGIAEDECRFKLSGVSTTDKIDGSQGKSKNIRKELKKFLHDEGITDFNIAFLLFTDSQHYGVQKQVLRKFHCIGNIYRTDLGVFHHEIGHTFLLGHPAPRTSPSSYPSNLGFTHITEPPFGCIMNNCDHVINVNQFALPTMTVQSTPVSTCGNDARFRIQNFAGAVQSGSYSILLTTLVTLYKWFTFQIPDEGPPC